eukprot:475010_1
MIIHQFHGSSRFEIKDNDKEKNIIHQTLQGCVIIAKDLFTNNFVVIKEATKKLVHQRSTLTGLKIAEDFLSERNLLIRLKHDGIIQLIDYWDTDTHYYYAMQYCTHDLFAYINKYFRLKPSNGGAHRWVHNMCTIMYQLCTTIQWLHRQGYCHMDISLENVMLYDEKELTVKLIDFGLTRSCDKEGNVCCKGRPGKTEYMAPEVWDKTNQICDGTKADVWSLGIVLYGLLVGLLPYEIPDMMVDRWFRLVIRKKIRIVLEEQNRLCLMTDDALDLVQRMLRYADKRIVLDDVIKHSFFNSVKVGIGERKRCGRQRWRPQDTNVNARRVSRSRSR